MRLTTLLRICPAVWIAPALVLLALAYANNLPAATLDPYPLAQTTAGAWTVAVIAPVCAACAAWEGGRLRRAGWFGLPHVRSSASVAVASLVPVLTVGVAALAAAVGTKLLGAGGWAAPDPRVAAVACAVVAAHALLGYAIGLHVPVVVAVPTVLILGWCWMALPIALQPLWLRHLTGAWGSCCVVSADLAPRAVAGAVVVAAGLAGTAICLMRRDLDVPHVILAVAPAVLAFGLGATLVRGMGPDPAVARQVDLVCSSGQPRVCLWPEHRERLEEVSAIAARANEAWGQFGIAVPAEFSERRPTGLPPGAGSFGISQRSRPGDIVNGLAYSLLPPPPTCALAGGPFLGGTAARYIHAWLDDVAGLPRGELGRRFGPVVLRTTEAVRSLPPDRQRAWLESNLAAWRTCDVAPQLEPGP